MKKKAFILDDDPDVLKILSIFFERDGFEVSNTTDPEKALEVLSTQQFDAAIIDVNLGTQTCEPLLYQLTRIKSPNLDKIILVTGYFDLTTINIDKTLIERFPRLQKGESPALMVKKAKNILNIS